MRRNLCVALSVLALLAMAGLTASVWLIEWHRLNPRNRAAQGNPRLVARNVARPTEPPFRAAGDKELDGEWERQSCVADGKEWGAAPPEVRYVLAFKGGVLQFLIAAKEDDEREVCAEWVVRTDASAVPKAIDHAPSEDAREATAEPCIYEVNGDEMRICWPEQPPGLDDRWSRPTEFSGKQGSGLKLETYHRVKR